MSAILVTSGAGFSGSNFVLGWIAQTGDTVVNLDKLTYAGNLGNLESLQGDPRYIFVRGDIGSGDLVTPARLSLVDRLRQELLRSRPPLCDQPRQDRTRVWMAG